MFQFPLQYFSLNGTGVGEFAVYVETVDGVPVQDTQLNFAHPPGTHVVFLNVETKPDPNCDPSQGPCEKWLPGLYNATVGKLL